MILKIDYEFIPELLERFGNSERCRDYIRRRVLVLLEVREWLRVLYYGFDLPMVYGLQFL